MNVLRHALVFLLLMGGVSHLAHADTAWYSVTWENDFIANDDSGYSNGLGLGWGYGTYDNLDEVPLPNWISNIAIYLPGSKSADHHAISYWLSHAIFTPSDIEESELIADDRPYAGLLLWQANIHNFDTRLSDRFGLTFGVIGPAAGAEPIQRAIHSLIREDIPNGWSNQIQNEMVFAFSGERLLRLSSGQASHSLEYDWIGMSAADLGTLRSGFGAGIGFRLGHALDRSFPAASIIPGRNINPLAASLNNEWHVFVNLLGRYVFNDITLDGNTFKDSHSVTLKNEQLIYAVGGAFNQKNWGLVFSVQDSTQTFEERDENSLFFNLSYTYR